MAAQAAGPDPGEWDRLRRLARELRPALRRLGREGRLAAMAAAVVEGVRDPALSDADALRLALLAREVRVRDVGCALITGEDAEQHLALWLHVVARLPPELAVAPLCLLGVSAWAAGNGTLLNCCATGSNGSTRPARWACCWPTSARGRCPRRSGTRSRHSSAPTSGS